jgi:hypothetical protein
VCLPDENCICPEIFAPVCGVNGQTYDNSCFAQCVDVPFTDGACQEVICPEVLCETACLEGYQNDANGCQTCECEGDPLALICGGFAGFECPDGYMCIDDPSDNCDPRQGGADCIGICVE